MLQKVGLGHALDKYPSALSGGMQQRLAIAQALIMQPRVLLLDEPFGALDPGIRKDMHSLLLELWHATQLTVFMVTHDLSEGFSLGTRLLVFDKTRIDPHAPNALARASPTTSPSTATAAPPAPPSKALPAHISGNLQPAH
jgi:NitT/TauT family transport system ATP-binding protein